MRRKKAILWSIAIIGLMGAIGGITTNHLLSGKSAISNKIYKQKYLNLLSLNNKINENNKNLEKRINDLNNENQKALTEIEKMNIKIEDYNNINSKEKIIFDIYRELYRDLKERKIKLYANLNLAKREIDNYKTIELENKLNENLLTNTLKKFMNFIFENNKLIDKNFEKIKLNYDKKIIEEDNFKNLKLIHENYKKIYIEYKEKIENQINLESKKASMVSSLEEFYYKLFYYLQQIDTNYDNFINMGFKKIENSNYALEMLNKKRDLNISTIKIKDNEIEVLRKEIEENNKKLAALKEWEKNKSNGNGTKNTENDVISLKFFHSKMINNSIENFKQILNFIKNLEFKNDELINEIETTINVNETGLKKLKISSEINNGKKIEYFQDLVKAVEIHNNFIMESNKNLTNYFTYLVNENIKSVNKIKEVNKDKKIADEKIMSFSLKLAEKNSEIEENNNTIKQFKIEIDNLKNQINKNETTLNNSTTSQDQKSNIVKLEAKIKELIHLNKDLEKEKLKYNETIESFKSDLTNDNERIIKLESIISVKDNIVYTLRQTTNSLKNELEYLNTFKGPNGELVKYSEFSDLSEKFKNLKNNNNDLNNIIADFDEKEKKFEATRSKIIKEQETFVKKINEVEQENKKIVLESKNYMNELNIIKNEKKVLQDLYNKEREKNLLSSNELEKVEKSVQDVILMTNTWLNDYQKMVKVVENIKSSQNTYVLLGQGPYFYELEYKKMAKIKKYQEENTKNKLEQVNKIINETVKRLN